MLWPVFRAEGTAGFVSLPASSPGPSSGVEGSPGEDLRPKDGIFLAREDSAPGMPTAAVLLPDDGRPAAQTANLSNHVSASGAGVVDAKPGLRRERRHQERHGP